MYPIKNTTGEYDLSRGTDQVYLIGEVVSDMEISEDYNPACDGDWCRAGVHNRLPRKANAERA